MAPIIEYQVSRAYQEPYREDFPDVLFPEDKLEDAVRCVQVYLDDGTEPLVVSLGKATYTTQEHYEDKYPDGFEWLLSIKTA